MTGPAGLYVSVTDQSDRHTMASGASAIEKRGRGEVETTAGGGGGDYRPMNGWAEEGIGSDDGGSPGTRRARRREFLNHCVQTATSREMPHVREERRHGAHTTRWRRTVCLKFFQICFVFPLLPGKKINRLTFFSTQFSQVILVAFFNPKLLVIERFNFFTSFFFFHQDEYFEPS